MKGRQRPATLEPPRVRTGRGRLPRGKSGVKPLSLRQFPEGVLLGLMLAAVAARLFPYLSYSFY